MNEQTHTPGPWTVTGPGPYDTESRVTLTVAQDSPTKTQVALVGNAHALMTRAEAEANARLIAAAPELLAACKLALECMDGEPIPSTWLLTDLVNAITKATGGEA
tara:strand:+ start:192 stop:506 length:315 start_codon:yes stop_codon:yes gene_type:complete